MPDIWPLVMGAAVEIHVLGTNHIEVQANKHTCFLLDNNIAIDAGSLTTFTTLEERCNIQAFLVTHRYLGHVRDLPGFGLVNLDYPGTVPITSLQETLDSIARCDTRAIQGEEP